MPERPRPVTIHEAVERAASGGGYLLGVDFDGTLAPIVEHPDLATPDPKAVELIQELAARDDVDVAIVSGRALADLRERLGEVAGAILIGEHGNDIGEEAGDDPLIRKATDLIRELSDEAGGVTVETKAKSVTFHYRDLEDSEAEGYLERIRDWAGRHDGVSVMEGKKVIELSTATRNKGDAILELAEGRPVVYIGDDTTDESVFAILGLEDVGVKVGEGPTAARYQVKDVAEVVTILEKIALASR